MLGVWVAFMMLALAECHWCERQVLSTPAPHEKWSPCELDVSGWEDGARGPVNKVWSMEVIEWWVQTHLLGIHCVPGQAILPPACLTLQPGVQMGTSISGGPTCDGLATHLGETESFSHYFMPQKPETKSKPCNWISYSDWGCTVSCESLGPPI